MSESQIKRMTRMTQNHLSLSGGGARRAGEENPRFRQYSESQIKRMTRMTQKHLSLS